MRVHQLVPAEQWASRYDVINCFEARLSATTKVVKCFLHISAEEQRKRLLARLDDPKKWWKYRPGDLDDHARWHDYQLAYADVLCRCNTEAAPWYVVPADNKWFTRLVVAAALAEALPSLREPRP